MKQALPAMKINQRKTLAGGIEDSGYGCWRRDTILPPD